MFNIDRRFQGIIFSDIQGQAGSKVTTEEREGEDDGWMNG
jgi:hypothetical protein